MGAWEGHYPGVLRLLELYVVMGPVTWTRLQKVSVPLCPLHARSVHGYQGPSSNGCAEAHLSGGAVSLAPHLVLLVTGLHLPGPWASARLTRAAGPFPVNTSPFTSTFLSCDSSCFDETLYLAVQVPKRGPRRPQPQSRQSFWSLCSQPWPHTQPHAFRRGCVNGAGPWPPPVPRVPVASALPPFPADRARPHSGLD